MTRIACRLALLVGTSLLIACGTDASNQTDPDGSLLDADSDAADVTEEDGSTDTATDGATDGATDVIDQDSTDDVPPGDVDPDGTADGGDTATDTDVDPVPGGGDCESDRDCEFGTYCDLRFTTPGYCAPAPDADGNTCVSNDDCVLEDSDMLFCCAEFAGSRSCAIAGDPDDGAVCGDADGTQGDSCADGGLSDCDGESHYCIYSEQDYAYCSELCRTNDPNACDSGSYCYPTGSGFGLCLEYGDIEDQGGCTGQFTSCGENSFCIANDVDDPYAYCAQGCAGDFDCDEDSFCSDYGICDPRGPIGLGGSCVEDRFGCSEGLICLYWGTQVAECSNLCERGSDCESGFFCNYYNETQGICRESGTLENGDFCGNDPFGCSGYCSGGYQGYDPGAYCIEECQNDDDCGDGAYCDDFGEGGTYCQPDGTEGQGDSCALSPFDCARDHFCVGFGTSDAFCVAGCIADANCDSGTWCTGDAEEPGACIPYGDIPAGESCVEGEWTCEQGSYCAGGEDNSQCFTTCTDDPDICADGNICLDANDQGVRWCYPTGDIAYGDSCVDDAYGCEYPGFCANASTDDARCTTGCESSDDCQQDDWCFSGPGGGVCQPAGDTGRLGSCEGDVYACEEPLVCLLGGNNGAFCADECTGFANSCEAGERCRFVGYTRSFCMGVGEEGHGDSCVGDQFACDANSWCVNAGTENAVCVQTCSFDSGSCPDATRCQFLSSGLGVCISAGLNPDDPLNPSGNPF